MIRYILLWYEKEDYQMNPKLFFYVLDIAFMFNLLWKKDTSR